MKSTQSFLVLITCLLGSLSISACTGAVPNPTNPTRPTVSPNEAPLRLTAQAAGDETSLDTRESLFEDDVDFVQRVLILYTNDEHGWMEGVRPDIGAASLVATWQANHNFEEYHAVILISGGDMWTGPAISTWFEGESMVEVMNAMGYAAAAVGNHEFDFSLDRLVTNAEQSTFPFVSANVRLAADPSQTPLDYGIEPYTVLALDSGMRVGITGLTTTSTPVTTNPAYITDLTFIDYEMALRQVIPDVEAENVDMILVPGHVCSEELRLLAGQVADLPIDLLGGGHCNELLADDFGSSVVLIGGSHMATYAWTDITIDLIDGQIIERSFGTEFTDSGVTPDNEILAVVDRWRDATDAELNDVIGYLDRPIFRRSQTQQALITESWLYAYPTADVALTNLGGFRDDIPAGEVTQGEIVGVFPFNNVIIELQIEGRDLFSLLGRRASALAIGGIEQFAGRWRFKATGEDLDPNEVYSVLVNDFMYGGGDGYDILAELDPEGYNTAIDWRQPLIDWMEDQESSDRQPLDEAIEAFTD